MKDLENKIQDLHGYIDAVKSICEKIDCYDDFEEVHSYLKAKFDDMYELDKSVDKTIEETKKAHEKELKEKIKEKVNDHKAKKEPAKP